MIFRGAGRNPTRDSMAKKAAQKTRLTSKAKPARPVRKAAKQKAPPAGKWVYAFGGGKAEGKAGMRNLLGGKGAGLAEMANLGLPVPPGFTITTEVCTHYYANDRQYPKALKSQVEAGLADIAPLTR